MLNNIAAVDTASAKSNASQRVINTMAATSRTMNDVFTVFAELAKRSFTAEHGVISWCAREDLNLHPLRDQIPKSGVSAISPLAPPSATIPDFSADSKIQLAERL